MSNPTVHDMAAQLLDAARKAGADEADVLAVEADGLSVKTRNGKTDEVERSETQDFGLRVFLNKASAVVSGAVRSADDMTTMAERAVAMAKIAPPDPSLGLLDPSLGPLAHNARVTLDLMIADAGMEAYLDFFRALYKVGMGRSLIVLLRAR